MQERERERERYHDIPRPKHPTRLSIDIPPKRLIFLPPRIICIEILSMYSPKSFFPIVSLVSILCQRKRERVCGVEQRNSCYVRENPECRQNQPRFIPKFKYMFPLILFEQIWQCLVEHVFRISVLDRYFVRPTTKTVFSQRNHVDQKVKYHTK
jgi:hypothetical protein